MENINGNRNVIIICKDNFERVPPHIIERLYDTLNKLNYYIPDGITVVSAETSKNITEDKSV